MNNNAYDLGPKLIFRGFLLGSIFVCLVGFYLTAQVALPTRAEEVLQVTPTLIETFAAQEAISMTALSPPTGDQSENNCKVSDKYPPKVRQWCEWIGFAADKYDLPADLIAAVILVESAGDALAYSHSGAVGLMQVMPRDGLASQFMCVNGPCFANRPTIKQLQDPQFNIDYGTKLLAGLIKRHGTYREALKAYGPMKVGYSYADKVLEIYRQYGK